MALHSPFFSTHFAGKCRPCLLLSTRKQETAAAVVKHSLRRLHNLGVVRFGSPVLMTPGTKRVSGRYERRVWDGDDEKQMGGNMELEDEIFEFMQKSGKPNDFPTKEELIDSGRLDLVEAILAQRGWLTAGWNLEEEEKGQEQLQVPETRVSEEGLSNGSFYEGNHRQHSRGFTTTVASSGRSIETENDDSGGQIEGILSRLKKERNSYAVEARENEGKSLRTPAVSSNDRSSKSASLSTDLFNDSGGLHPQNGTLSNLDRTRVPEDWKTLSLQRAGFTMTGLEDDIVSERGGGRMKDYGVETDILATGDEICASADCVDQTEEIRIDKSLDDPEKYQNHIQSRIQDLELELTSILCLLRSKTVSAKDRGSSLEELHELSDAWEFQETEIMKTRDKLRSTRAKIAVLEGKMALEFVEAYKVMEEKQKRIEEAQKVLSLLQTTCIVWPIQGSEVFLAGSFDGWTSQRRMERLSTGEFCLNLKLYPGRYEIKFVVDGVWRVDPLRPVVNYNGYENNLLIIN